MAGSASHGVLAKSVSREVLLEVGSVHAKQEDGSTRTNDLGSCPAFLVTRVVHVIKEHRALLSKPGRTTGWLVRRWAPVMVLPQFLLAPLTLFFGRMEGPLIFVARFLAMHICYYLDQWIPMTRGLGLCHLLTFGPLLLYFTLNLQEIVACWGTLAPLFIVEYAIIAVCLYLDIRDFILHFVAGRPFPCYVRDYQRLGLIDIQDERIKQLVTLFSIFFW